MEILRVHMWFDNSIHLLKKYPLQYLEQYYIVYGTFCLFIRQRHATKIYRLWESKIVVTGRIIICNTNFTVFLPVTKTFI